MTTGWENNVHLLMSEMTQLVLMLKEKGVFDQADIDTLLDRTYAAKAEAEEGYQQYLAATPSERRRAYSTLSVVKDSEDQP